MIFIVSMRKFIYILSAIVLLLLVATIGGSFYMADYALAPNPERHDTTQRFASLYENYPQTRLWVDTLRRQKVLRDTFVLMPSGEHHHGYLIGRHSAKGKTAVVVHGWRNQGIDILQIARLYQLMGYHVVVPDLHAHGLSEGDAITMGWNDRKDLLHWMELFRADTMVVHGISMGAATTMNVSGEKLPAGIRSMKFVEDCGYTSVWAEFTDQLDSQFGLPPFPLLYASSLLCQLKYGWNFLEAAPLKQIAKCRYPMLLIHGDADDFVPFWMVHLLYEAKPSPKQLWVTKDTRHALSYKDYPEEYEIRLRDFLK